MGVLRLVDDPRHWSGDLRLELLAKSCPSHGDNTAAGSATKVLTQNRYLTAKKRTHNGRPTPQIFTRVAASTAHPLMRELSVEHWLAPERRVVVYLRSSARVTTPPAELSMTWPHIAM
jgi:hypothetical protein